MDAEPEPQPDTEPTPAADGRPSGAEVFRAFLRLGLTCFGGPVAHLGYFRDEFVVRRRWLDDRAYADLVALCQFLPGPASSQVGVALGLLRAGWLGAAAAWIGFTLPSAILMTAFGLSLRRFDAGGAWLHGLKVVAVAVVAQALWGMGRTLCPDRPRATIAFVAAVALLVAPGAAMQLAVIAAGGIVGLASLRTAATPPHRPFALPLGARAGAVVLVVFFALLAALPLLAQAFPVRALQVADAFYRAGALVFGGGHVVLPLLQSQAVATGWVSDDVFLAGYGAAQAVPGPLFTFAAYLGAVFDAPPNGVAGAALALVAIFLPAFLLVVGALPLWERARRYAAMQRAMLGINAAVVGVLLAAFYDPVWTSAIASPADVALALVAFALLTRWNVPPWLVVAGCAAAAGLGWR